MGYVFLGHGGLTPSDAANMEICALSAGTTLQYFSDSGQSLLHNPEHIAPFDALERPWPAIDSTGVTYNLGLEPVGDATLLAEYQARDWSGHMLLTPDGELGCEPRLCTGTPETCPTDPRTVAWELAGPYEHECNGILARYAGQELFWVACTAISGFGDAEQAAVQASRGVAPEHARIGTDPGDPIPTALLLINSPTELGEYFDLCDAAEQARLLENPDIADWHASRST